MQQSSIAGRARHAALAALAACLLLFPAASPAEDPPDGKTPPPKTKVGFRLMGGFNQGVLLRQQKGGLMLAYVQRNDLATTRRDYRVTIDWGDKTGTTRGQLTGEYSYKVTGNHTYASGGYYPVSVAVTGPDGTTRTTTSSIQVGDVFAGSLEVQTLASFPASRVGETGRDFAVRLDWGDGKPGTAGAVTRAGNRFLVQGTHAYVTNGTFFGRALVTAGGVVRCHVTRTVRVVPAPVTDFKSIPFTYSPDEPMLNVPVAEFTVANPLARAGDYGGRINWGDGTPTDDDVTIVGTGGRFRVIGSHTYTSGTILKGISIVLSQTWH